MAEVAAAEDWERLRDKLVAAGFDAKLSARDVASVVDGRRIVARRISIDLASRGTVDIIDTSWHGMWSGFKVWRDDRDGYVMRQFKARKRFSDVVSDVSEAVA